MPEKCAFRETTFNTKCSFFAQFSRSAFVQKCEPARACARARVRACARAAVNAARARAPATIASNAMMLMMNLYYVG